jgi:hypothetical protein
MTANAHKGEVSLLLGGKEHIVLYDWNALAKVQAQLGTDFDRKLAEATTQMNVAVLADVLSAGLERHNAMTADEIKAASPPVMDVVMAIIKAMNIAFHGTTTPAKEAKADAEENPPRTSSLTPAAPPSAPG